jgi:hypothetical protein
MKNLLLLGRINKGVGLLTKKVGIRRRGVNKKVGINKKSDDLHRLPLQIFNRY